MGDRKSEPCPTCGSATLVDGDCPHCNPSYCEACLHIMHLGLCPEPECWCQALRVEWP